MAAPDLTPGEQVDRVVFRGEPGARYEVAHINGRLVVIELALPPHFTFDMASAGFDRGVNHRGEGT